MIHNYNIMYEGIPYKFSLKGCPHLYELNSEEVNTILNKVKKITSGRNDWGTCSIREKSVTIKIERGK